MYHLDFLRETSVFILLPTIKGEVHNETRLNIFTHSCFHNRLFHQLMCPFYCCVCRLEFTKEQRQLVLEISISIYKIFQFFSTLSEKIAFFVFICPCFWNSLLLVIVLYQSRWSFSLSLTSSLLITS